MTDFYSHKNVTQGRIGSFYTFLIGDREGQRGTSGKTNDFSEIGLGRREKGNLRKTSDFLER